ncbi:protein misato homolog 1 [Strongylocentrotus purpuratus]|uniref:Protein misato homolog 1 n=1 Tax=Strongylocentrotus purpuratus TaxID=7668 RepID=A0A7M7SUW1_STRPU|nr:protein misato homolog 1 [Strongylocentrotus purpuratus]
MAGKTREIVTLQCGHYANFVGTHLWNIQESSFTYDKNPAQTIPKEINNDVLFREGRTLQGEETYTPRLVCLDLKGSLNTLRAEGILYDLKAEEDVLWGGDITLHKSSPAHKNQFLADLEAQDEYYHQGEPKVGDDEDDLSTPDMDTSEVNADDSKFDDPPGLKHYDLDDDVYVWSDFLRSHLHPKSVSVVKEYSHDSTVGGFDMFTQGKNVFRKKDVSDEIEDKIHFFVEECDHLQGFQVYLDFCDGFSGLGCGMLQGLADDYHGKGIFAAGVAPAIFDDTNPLLDSFRILNSVLSFSRLVAHSSLFVPLSLASTLWRKVGPPLSFPHLQYRPSMPYHTSGILASALDTATLPLRTVDSSVTLSMMTDALGARGRKIASLHTSFPLSFHSSSTLADTLGGSLLPCQPLTPHLGQETVAPFAQSVVLRGTPQDRIKRPPQKDLNPYHKCYDEEEMLRNYLLSNYQRTLSSGRCVKQPCKTLAPFPHLFGPEVNRDGFLADEDRKKEQGVESIPAMTSLQSSPAVKHLLKSLLTEARKLDIHKFHGYLEEGLEEDEFKEHLQDLEQLMPCYLTEIEKEFDDGDDDDDYDDVDE